MLTVEMFATFAGGLGLFLLGMRLMTEGLRVAAGRALRDVLQRYTKTRLRGLFAGASITALVQSSSAVTVAAIGFVNAGLLRLEHAIWVVFGANVGTTMTGWLVALTGLSFRLEPYALPAIGIGMLLSLTGPSTRRGALGEAIAGLGLFFVGLTFLQDAFTSVAAQTDLGAIGAHSALAGLAFFGVGTLLTVVMQSSSAAIALTLSAATTGLIGEVAAAAMVIGANVGTTSTAILATIGATPNARRAAAAHVIFNVLAAAVALLLLPVLIAAIDGVLATTGVRPKPATLLAAFHTTFNVLGVALMWPMSRRLVVVLGRRFKTREEEETKPRHLDANVLAIPSVAVRALDLEVRRVGHFASEAMIEALDDQGIANDVEGRRRAADSLLEAISDYVARLDRAKVLAETANAIQALMRAAQHYVIVLEQASAVVVHRESHDDPEPRARAAMAPFFESVRDCARLGDPTERGFELPACEQAFGALQDRYDATIAKLLEDVTKGRLEPKKALAHQHFLSEARRGAKHLVRAAEALPSWPSASA